MHGLIGSHACIAKNEILISCFCDTVPNCLVKATGGANYQTAFEALQASFPCCMFGITGTAVDCPGILPLSALFIGSQITSIRFGGVKRFFFLLVGFAEAGQKGKKAAAGKDGKRSSRQTENGWR